MVLKQLGLEQSKYNALHQYLKSNEEMQVDVYWEVALGFDMGAELLEIQEVNGFDCDRASILSPLIESKIYDRLSDEEFESAWGW